MEAHLSDLHGGQDTSACGLGATIISQGHSTDGQRPPTHSHTNVPNTALEAGSLALLFSDEMAASKGRLP